MVSLFLASRHRILFEDPLRNLFDPPVPSFFVFTELPRQFGRDTLLTDEIEPTRANRCSRVPIGKLPLATTAALLCLLLAAGSILTFSVLSLAMAFTHTLGPRAALSRYPGIYAGAKLASGATDIPPHAIAAAPSAAAQRFGATAAMPASMISASPANPVAVGAWPQTAVETSAAQTR